MRALSRRIALSSIATLVISPRLASASSQNDQDVGLPSPGLPPQDAVPHPSLYWETGIDESVSNLRTGIRTEFVLIVGGTDVNGRDGGVYIAQDFEQDGTLTVERLQNGFFLLVLDKWAKDEFRFRLEQAGAYQWDRGHVFVPESWINEFREFNPLPVSEV